MEYFRFINWKVYKDSKNLYSKISLIVKSLPRECRFEIGSQLMRSSLSVVLNIAEGSGKQSEAELNRYLSIASGSLFEVLATLDVLKDEKYITQVEFNKYLLLIEEISKQIGGLKKSTKKLS